MAYQNFIPTVWSEAIQRELARACVFAENTNREFEGDVKKMGDAVRILGVGKPTIFQSNDKSIVLSDPEVIEDTSVQLAINQVAYFNYRVDDIDRSQAVGGVMEALSKETSEGLASVMDSYIANLAKAPEAVLDEKTAYQVTKENILQKIDAALEKLWENDVTPQTNVTITVSPRFYSLMRQANIELDTDNSEMLRNGTMGQYAGVTVKLSNNVAKSAAGDLIQLKTDRAIAFCNPLTHTEAFRPEKGFSDAVKGFVLYDAKIVRPKEMVVMNVKYTA